MTTRAPAVLKIPSRTCKYSRLFKVLEVSLLVAELRAIEGVIRLSMEELEDEGGEGESAKGKRGTTLRGGGFYHFPLCALLSLSLANCRRK